MKPAGLPRLLRLLKKSGLTFIKKCLSNLLMLGCIFTTNGNTAACLFTK